MLETVWESRWVPGYPKNRPGRVLYRTDISQWAEEKAKPAKTDVLTRSSREVLLINWFLPVIREAKHIEFPDD